jgi:uncharacterized coiled-coil protein SlyX
MDNELAELQILLMEHQRSMDSLSEQLIIQSKKILGLENQLKRLEARVTESSQLSDNEQTSLEQRPPHY